MNPERRRSPEPESNSMSDEEAEKVMDSMSDNKKGKTKRGRMDASVDLSSEAKQAEGIVEDIKLDQTRLEEDLTNVSELVDQVSKEAQEDKGEKVVADSLKGLEEFSAESDRKDDEKFVRWQEDQRKIKELGEKALEDQRKIEAAKADLQSVTDEEIDAAVEQAFVEVPTEEEKEAERKKQASKESIIKKFQGWLSRQKDKKETQQSLDELQKLGRERTAEDDVIELSGEDLEDVEDAEELTDADVIKDGEYPSPWDKQWNEQKKEKREEKAEDGEGVITSAPTMEQLTAEQPELIENETEEKFFEEGDIMNSNADEFGRSEVAGNRGYVERAGGDWVRGEGRHADLSEAARALSTLRKKLKDAKNAYSKMSWYKKLMNRGTIRGLESQISDAKDRLAESRQALKNPTGHQAAKKLQSERRK